MLKFQNKASIYVFIGLALIVTTLYIVLFFVNKKVTKIPKLPLPNPSNFPEPFKNKTFKNKETFADVDQSVFNKNVDLPKMKKLVIKKSDSLYNNIKIFCNDNTKDIEFYFNDDKTKEQFYSNLNYYNFTFYFFLPRGEVNKYVIDIPNYNATIKAENTIMFSYKFSLYNVGLNILNDNKDYETTTRDSLKESFTKYFSTFEGYVPMFTLYLYYSLFFEDLSTSTFSKIDEFFNSTNAKFVDGFLYIIENAKYENIINGLLNMSVNTNIEKILPIINQIPKDELAKLVSSRGTLYTDFVNDFDAQLSGTDTEQKKTDIKNKFESINMTTKISDLSTNVKIFISYIIFNIYAGYCLTNTYNGIYVNKNGTKLISIIYSENNEIIMKNKIETISYSRGGDSSSDSSGHSQAYLLYYNNLELFIKPDRLTLQRMINIKNEMQNLDILDNPNRDNYLSLINDYIQVKTLYDEAKNSNSTDIIKQKRNAINGYSRINTKFYIDALDSLLALYTSQFTNVEKFGNTETPTIMKTNINNATINDKELKFISNNCIRYNGEYFVKNITLEKFGYVYYPRNSQ